MLYESRTRKWPSCNSAIKVALGYAPCGFGIVVTGVSTSLLSLGQFALSQSPLDTGVSLVRLVVATGITRRRVRLSRLRETLEMVLAIDAFPSLDDSLETSRSAGLFFESPPPKTFRERVQYGRAAQRVLRLARETEARTDVLQSTSRTGATAPFSLDTALSQGPLQVRAAELEATRAPRGCPFHVSSALVNVRETARQLCVELVALPLGPASPGLSAPQAALPNLPVLSRRFTFDLHRGLVAEHDAGELL